MLINFTFMFECALYSLYFYRYKLKASDNFSYQIDKNEID